jgi:beta-lactamase superfamily II metal-dependent hydrolase
MTCEISFLPVGNSDCIVIQADNSVVLVDLGKNPRFIYKWLQNNGLNKINRIYITHSHKDHFPFRSLVNLVQVLNLWFSSSCEIEIFSLPYGVYKDALKKLNTSREVDADYKELEDALHSLDDWDRRRRVRFVEASCDPTPYSLDDLKIYTLHPRAFFLGNHKNNINEISLVLRVVYGEFAAMLLADLEGVGLKDYLSVVKSSIEATKEAKANIVKIPHHGGFPSNGDDLKELLALIDAELAVLSVGSTNQHTHVKPELFKSLIELQNNNAKHLKKFICTEVTRTCVHSASVRAGMGKTGLPSSEKCAGEITVIAESSGIWELKVEESDHLSKVSSFTHAACIGLAELD